MAHMDTGYITNNNKSYLSIQKGNSATPKKMQKRFSLDYRI